METHDSIARSSASLRTMATNFRCSMDLLAGQSVPLLDMLRLPNKRVIACIGDGSFQVRDKFHTNLLTHLCWSEVGIGKEWVGQPNLLDCHIWVQPYLGIKNGSTFTSTVEDQGVNFAVVGATALDVEFFIERGIIYNVGMNNSLRVQLDWFKEILASLCNTSSKCNEMFGSSVFLMGEIGGNDYNYPFFLKRSMEEIRTFVPLVIKAIASAIYELIDLGAVTLMVPGNLPIGCSAAYLTYYETADKEEYDPATGCLNWLNKFAEYHNDQLQKELSRIQAQHPQTNIIYADYYNAATRLYSSPSQFGFKKTLTACCGRGGPYNYNKSAVCGNPGVSACVEPSQYVNWDGIHLTEAAYKLITQALLQAPMHTIPRSRF